jgi:hypothetical protein
MARYRTQGGFELMRNGPDEKLFGEDNHCVAGVFRDDYNHRVEIEIYDKRTPPASLGALYSRAWVTLDPFEDGTPLIEGKLPRIFRQYERSAESKARAAKGQAYYWKNRAKYLERGRLKYQKRKAAEAAKGRAAARGAGQRAKGSSGS